MKLLAVVAVVLCSVPYLTTGEKLRVICYWANSLPDGMKPEQIDPTLCTHLHYAFHQIDDKNNVIIDEKGSAQPDTYTRLLALKKINPDMKLIVSVGGWARPDIKWSRLVNSAELRREFIRNTIPYLQKYKFDGLDLDWEYPVCWTGNCTAGPKSDKVNFGLFVKEIRAAFEKLTPRLTISAAVVAGTDIADISYDYKVLGEALDYVNIMTYDLAPVTWKHTAHHSPYALCIQNVNEWVDRGVPKAKCQLGVPFHARTFTLVNEAVHGNNAPTTGNGKKDYEAYRNVCNLVKKDGWTKEHINGTHNPYTYKGDEWIGYDDPYAAYDKSKWVKDNGFGGIIIWEVGLDDYTKQCCTVANPMLQAINHGLYGTGQAPDTYGCEQK